MKDLIRKLFGTKYESKLERFSYNFSVLIWLLFIGMVVVSSLVFKDIGMFLGGIITSLMFVVLFRIVYRFNAYLFGRK